MSRSPRAPALVAALALLLPAVSARASHTEEVCHRTGAGRWVPISVAPSAVPAHLRHGDTTPGAWFQDADGDGLGDPGAPTRSCEPPAGFVQDASDCDDTRAEVGPGTPEVCDGVDNDCDGQLDGPDAADARRWYADRDGDGHGDPASWVIACAPPWGYTADGTDCDDARPEVHPGAVESCTPWDDDCDGQINEDGAAGETAWFVDGDGDGHGDPTLGESACAQPPGTVGTPTDCDDRDDAVHPGAEETCDGRDQDCDGAVDEEAVDRLTFAVDADGDGHGDPTLTALVCDGGPGWVLLDRPDCDDTDPRAHPEAVETCDGRDDDCDGVVDEPDAADAQVWYADPDGDGCGDPGDSASACEAPGGYVAETCDPGDGDDGPLRHLAFTASGPVSWFTAAADCEARGLHLVTVGDPDEALLLEALDPGPTLYWIGGARPTWETELRQLPGDTTGAWTWTTPEAWSWTGWADGEGLGADGEDCAAALIGGDGWYDLPCDAPVSGWICEDDGLSPVDADGDGFSWGAGDCDDRSDALRPGKVEDCDGFDDDCDGAIDEDFAVVGSHWYWDGDGDGFGVYDLALHTCEEPPAGFSPIFGDCDDADAAVIDDGCSTP